MKKVNTVFAAFLAVTLGVCLLCGCEGGVSTSDTAPAAQSAQADSDTISIPGYEKLSFKAGKKKQSVNFHNPETNTCYFRMSLSLKSDDVEETLWTSEYVRPGEEIKSIKLAKKLESGDYAAVLKYECFSLKDETPLNGSAIELTIEVR